MRKCYPQPPATGRGCIPEPADTDGCFPGPRDRVGPGGPLGSLLRDFLRAATTPPESPRRPSPRADRGRTRTTHNF
jgi:hypothetical protein